MERAEERRQESGSGLPLDVGSVKKRKIDDEVVGSKSNSNGDGMCLKEKRRKIIDLDSSSESPERDAGSEKMNTPKKVTIEQLFGHEERATSTEAHSPELSKGGAPAQVIVWKDQSRDSRGFIKTTAKREANDPFASWRKPKNRMNTSASKTGEPPGSTSPTSADNQQTMSLQEAEK